MFKNMVNRLIKWKCCEDTLDFCRIYTG